MNRRQSSLDRPGILSPPGPFLTPSPSPSIPIASPRLAPSPSISPFSQDVLLVTNNTITNTTQEQERKAATPGRRQSIHQLNSGSPNAGTVVFQPSPSQSPAAATTVIGVTGNEFNTTLVGSNNISLNKKGKRLSQSQQYSIGYGQQQTTTITTSGTSSSSSYVVNSCPKGQTKKGYNNLINNSTNNNFIQNNQLQQQHNFLPNHAQLINPNGSPLLADSPIASPSGQIKPPTPQPQILHQFPTVLNTAGNHQLLQFLQGPQLIAAANAAIHQQHQQQQQQHQQRQLMSNTSTVQNTTQSNIKTSKGPQQILPKPQQQQSLDNNSKNVSKQHQHHHQQQQQVHQICQSPQPQIITQSSNQSGSGSNNSSPAGGGQIIQLPTGNLGSQPLLLNQMPVLVQQNTPQGVQLILRPPTPQLTAAPSLVIHNSRPQQLQQNHQQQPQLLRILNTNSGMQLATTPTFIVSSQANLIQQNLQHTLKANQAQTTGPITTLSGLQANPRSQQLAAAINNHIFGQNMAQLQNLQLNGNLAQIQMPNGLHGPIISQLPTQFQQSLAGFNQLAQNLNINQLNSANLQQQIAAAAAAAAANAAFQSPPPPQHQQQIPPHHHHQVSELQMPAGTAVGITSQNLQFSTTSTSNGGGNGNQQHISITSPAVTPQPQLLPSVTPEPRNPTPILQNIVTTQQPTTTTVLVQPDNLMQMQQNLISQQQIHQQQIQQQQMLHQQQQIKPQPPPPKARKPAKSRKKKVQPIPMTTTMTIPPQQHQQQIVTTTTITSPSTTTTTSSSPPMKSLTSTGKLDLANVMKLCGIMEDDDYMMDDEPMIVPSQQSQEDLIKLNEGNLTSSSPTTILSQQQQQQQQQLNSNDFMITIPSQNNSDMPFTFTIPANNNNNNQCDSKNSSISDIEMTINTNNNTTFGNSNSNSINSNINSGVGQSNNNNSSDTTTTKTQQQQQSNNNLTDAQQNFVIKIDQNDSGQPYTISIPSIPTSNDIQQSIQQQQQQVCQIISSSQQQQQQQSQQILQSNQQLTNLQTQQSQSIQMPSRSKSLTSPTSFTNNTFNSVPMSVGNNNLNTTSNIITSSNNNTITTTNFPNQQQLQQPTITSRMTEIQNHLIGAAAANAATISQQQQQLNINSGAMITQSSTNIKNNMVNSGNSTQTTNVCPITTTATTTATVKPRRKQPIKRNGKKVADSIISTPVGNVPSQIGNIQISQIDATKITNQQMPISNVVENKIQIMPIIDNSNNNNKIGNSTVTTQQQQIQNQIILQPNNSQQQITQQNFDKTQQILHQPQQQQMSTTSTQQQPTLTIPIQANAAQTPATTLISQLTGALSLAFSEDGGRLLLRHDPNNPQDSQSQLILQAVLSGALPNITIINEPLISDKTKTLINTTVGNNSTNFQQKNNNLNNCGSLSINNSTVTTTSKLNNNKNQSIQLNQQQQQFQIQSNNIQNNQFVGIVGPSGSIIHNNNNQAIDNLSLLQKRPSLEIKKNEIAQQSQNVVLPPPPLQQQQQQQFIQQNSNGNTTIVVNPNTPKLVTLPKIDSNQQLFSLNTLNNQITHISPGQTTASLGPMERLLIVPAGINAQQLAQCMLQGQIHFDNINPVPQAIASQQQQQQQFLPLSQQIPQQQPQINRIQQQIVHPQQHQPIQPLHQPINHQQNISTTTTTKQVANVAPIIDTSKTTVGKLETQKRKPKPRKPKVDLTNKTGTGATTATLKPIQKLDLNTKPNTNPVQIVQPTTAKDHLNQQQQQRTVASANQFVANSSSSSNSTTNSTPLTVSSSNSSIHPFNSSQTLSTGGGTKLIGVTAPMQQVNQNHRNMITNNCNISSNNNNQCNNINNSANINNNIMVNNNSVALNSTNTSLPVQQQPQNIIPPRSLTTTATSNSNLSNSTANVIPPLVSVNSSPQTITRVQTIQLTPQQQQLLKTVQIQIQQLSGKLQNKSLLSTLNIPADFDPNNPMYNKPLPSLVNIQQMSDSEIHGALQRLFIEQQKILASGKVIPTIPAPGSHHNFVHSPMLQQQSTTSPSPVQNHMQQQHQQQQQLIVNNFPTATNQQQQTNTFSNVKQIPPTPTGIATIKNEGQIIPSNIVQPNNHNSTIVPQQQLQQQSGNTQRIHIYPLQHQIQNKSITNLQTNSNQFQQQNQFQNQQQQQQKKDNNITNNNKQLLPTQQQLSQQQQQQLQIYGNQEDKSIILPTQINKNNIPNSSINDTKLSTVATTTIATAANIKTEKLPDLPDVKPILNNLPTTISAVPPVESTKPKIARHALFERQLDVDQQACIKPDYITPFQNKEEAVKRLIRYHCLYQQDEEFPSDEEIEFEKCAIEFQNKFQGLTNKFQNLIFKESMLPHRTSELCLINHLLVSDIQQELLDMRTEANNQNTLSSATNCNAIIKQETELNMNKQIQQSEKNISQFNINNYQDNQRLSFNRTPVEYINSSDSSGNYNYNSLIKNEIKSEPYDLNFMNKCDNNSIFTTTTVSTAIMNKISTSIVTTAAATSSEPLLSTSGIVKNITTNRLFNNIGVQQQQQQLSTIAATTIKNEKEILTIDFRNYQNNKINFQSINKHEKSTNYTIKKEMDNFDIESEITPSFIMKKIDNILPQTVTNNNNNQSTSVNISSAHSISSSSEDNDFAIDFNFTGQNNNNNQHSQQQSSNCYDNSSKFPTTINDIVGNNNRPMQQSLDSKLNQNEPYDEWLCIQKELNLITEKKSNLLSEQNLNNQQNNNNNHHHDNSNKSVEKELSEIFESSPSSKDVDNQISELFTNTPTTDNAQTNHLSNGDINHSPIKHQSLHLSELINSELININHDSIANKSVETRLEAMFGESPVIEKSDTSDLVESRLEELFNDDDDDDDDNDNNNINRINCINDDNIDENDTTNSPITSNLHHFNTQQQQQQMLLNKNINHKRSWPNHNNDDGDSDTDVTNKRSCLLTNNNNSIGDIQQNNSYIESQQQSQFGGVSGSNTRWMIDSQFDFIHQQQQHNRNEREWNGIENIHINQQQHIVNKKINFGNNNKSHDLVDNDDDDFVVGKSNWHGSTTINNHTSQITNNLMQHHHTSTLQPGDVHLQDTEFPQISTMSEDSNQMHIQHNLQHHQQQQQQQQHQHLMQTNLINQSIMQHNNSSLFDNDVHHLQQQHHHQQHHHHNLNTSSGSIGNIGDSVNLSGVGIDNVNNLGNISGGSSGAGSMTSNFDDDINRHVQNAIDSILNLQNSESDSLNFSLDNSMGSFLADSPLDHHQQQQQQLQQHQQQQQHLQHQQNSSILQQHCLLTGNTGSISSNININKRRSGRIDDLTDCLINGGASGDNSNMIHSPITPGGGGVSQSGLIGGASLTTTSGVVGGASSISGGNIHGMTDFSCVSAGIDDAVKSIMTS